jgi:cytoskeletal protein CcmA (bactofilin family)
MWKSKIIKYSALVIALMIFLGFGAGVHALTVRTGDSLSYTEKAFAGNTVLFGGKVSLESDVQGDLFVFSGEVNIKDSMIHGDLFVFAGRVSLDTVTVEDIRIFSGDLTLTDSLVSGEVIVAAGDMVVTGDTHIAGALHAGSGRIDIRSATQQSLKIYGGEVSINSNVAEDVYVNSAKLIVGPSAEIGGNLTYEYTKNGQRAEISDRAVIVGDVTQRVVAKSGLASSKTGPASFMFDLLMYLVFGLAVIVLFPVWSRTATEIMNTKSLRVLGWGLATLIITPILLILIFGTIVGVSLATTSLLFYGIAIYSSKIYAGLWLGIRLLKNRPVNKDSLIWQMALGVTAISLLSTIPVVGGVVTTASLLFGLGIISLGLMDTYHTSKK